MKKSVLYEVHVTDSRHVPFSDIPDLRGVLGWQNLLRRLFFVFGLESVQISKSQFRHFRGVSNDFHLNVYHY